MFSFFFGAFCGYPSSLLLKTPPLRRPGRQAKAPPESKLGPGSIWSCKEDRRLFSGTKGLMIHFLSVLADFLQQVFHEVSMVFSGCRGFEPFQKNIYSQVGSRLSQERLLFNNKSKQQALLV